MPLLPHPVAARVCAPLWSFFAALVLGPVLTDVVAPHQKVFAVFGLPPCALFVWLLSSFFLLCRLLAAVWEVLRVFVNAAVKGHEHPRLCRDQRDDSVL